MKKLYWFFSCVAAILLAGCNKWLEVNPRSQIKAEVLYSSSAGFRHALNGIYIQMSRPDLYGKSTSMYTPDGLARMWNVPTTNNTSLIYGLSNHNYTLSSVESEIKSIFSAYYLAIAQLNDLLKNLDDTKVAFEYNQDKLLKGEALGLRAFLHLDVLRLFGPVPVGVADNAKAIPYVTEMTVDIAKLQSKSWREVLMAIENDLTAAEEILNLYDPLLRIDNTFLNHPTADVSKAHENMPVDEWQFFRQSRFNYYAVLGAKARFYHWIGNKSKAALFAKKVIESGKFKLCREADVNGTAGSLTMFDEHLCGLKNLDLSNSVKTLFDSRYAELIQRKIHINSCYESGTYAGSDIRFVVPERYWIEREDNMDYYRFCKYTGNKIAASEERVPLLRYVEMYLILAEDLPLDEAKSYFVTYRMARAMSDLLDDIATASEQALVSQLEKEYRKEFYGEGQAFFFYKRHNYTSFTWPDNYVVPAGAYVVPMPKGMINFENI